MKDFYVYAYIRSIDSANGKAGSPFYIGKGRGKRDIDTHNVHIPHRSKIIRLAENMTEPDAFQAEMFLIHLYGRVDRGTGCLRNRTDGGEGPAGIIRSAQHRANLSIALKNMSLETRKKFSEAQRNKSEQHRQRIAAALTGKKLSEEARRKISKANTGRIVSDETRQKLSASHRGKRKPHSEETKAKLRLSCVGYRHTPEAIEKIRAASIAAAHKRRLLKTDETRGNNA